jgi:antitoxin component of MazEF toxin-antitoxin module
MVTLEPGDGGIRIVKRKYTLDEMLAGITPENIQPETDSGPDMGHEIVEY